MYGWPRSSDHVTNRSENGMPPAGPGHLNCGIQKTCNFKRQFNVNTCATMITVPPREALFVLLLTIAHPAGAPNANSDTKKVQRPCPYCRCDRHEKGARRIHSQWPGVNVQDAAPACSKHCAGNCLQPSSPDNIFGAKCMHAVSAELRLDPWAELPYGTVRPLGSGLTSELPTYRNPSQSRKQSLHSSHIHRCRPPPA